MITGTVSPAREAVVELTALGVEEGVQAEIQAVVDTGFNDYLTLPPDVISALGLSFAAPARATLADGSVVRMDYYRATVLWDGQARAILALAAEGGPLIGMGLLYGHQVLLDVVDGGNITIALIP